MGITDNNSIKQILEDYTWHHLDDLNYLGESTMQLVVKGIHKTTCTHMGSSKQIRTIIETTKKYLK